MDLAADVFASEFLLPQDAMSSELRSPLTITKLAELKQRWGVAMQAIARRAESIGIITQGQRKYIDKQMGVKGWMRNEPVHLKP